MALITSYPDFESYLDLLTTSPPQSLLRSLGQKGISTPTNKDPVETIKKLYGVELISISERMVKGRHRHNVVNKDALIDEMSKYVCNHPAQFTSSSLEGWVLGLKIASHDAEIAHDRDGSPDPRFRSCRAAARALAKIVALSYPEPAPARKALSALVTLGSANYLRCRAKPAVPDYSIIGHGYLGQILNLSISPAISPNIIAELLANKAVYENASVYFASVALCMRAYAKTCGVKIPALEASAASFGETDLEHTLYRLVQGMKVEKHDSRAAQIIGNMLCEIINDVDLSKAESLTTFVERLVQRECQAQDDRLTHQALLGDHLSFSGPLAVAAMKRVTAIRKAKARMTPTITITVGEKPKGPT